MYEGWHAPSPSTTPWDGVDESSLTPAQRLTMGWQGEQYERLHQQGGEAEAMFFNAFERSACPRCGSERIVMFGYDRQGVRRWRCNGCGRTFTPATKTIFEDRKLPVQGWIEFLLALMSSESLSGIARRDRRSPTTPSYQLAKLLCALDGIQDAVVLAGRARIDEMSYPVPASQKDPALKGRRAGSFSKSNTCIAVAREERDGGLSTLRVSGQGKPSGERACNAHCPNLALGLALVHDKGNAHSAVIRKLNLVSEAYDARIIKKLPDRENPLWKVNCLCLLSRPFLNAHTGFNRSNFAGWLNLFSLMMNPPEDRLQKAALALDRAMAFPNTLRRRDYYQQDPSPDK